jgi:hypothetical protein
MCTSSSARSRLPRLLALAVVWLIVPSAAPANDGGIALGGSPRLLLGHPTVRMSSEVIRLNVYERTVAADCRFTFTNSGPACTVRMGFPDQGIDALDPDEESDARDVMRTPPHTTFKSFQSWVDGRHVASTLIRANVEGEYWHAKMVRFPAHGTVHVRDVYTQAIGGGTTSFGDRSCVAAQVGYILHTGASWHGSIGRTEVVVAFRDPSLPRSLTAVRRASISRSHAARGGHARLPASSAIVWRGPCKPIVSGRTLRFVRERWRPATSDDIELTYAYAPLK